MHHLGSVLLGLIAVMSLTACATVFAPDPQPVPVRSVPEGAKVFVDGELAGRTPVTLSLPRRGRYQVMVRRGEQERVVVLESELEESYVALDVLPGLAVAGGSLALASSCAEALGCLVAAHVASVGVTGGLAASAGATTTDAISGAWYTLRPGVVEVRFP